MKRYLAYVLAVILVVGMSGCSSPEPEGKGEAAPEASTAATAGAQEKQTPPPETKKPETAVEEQVLLEEAGVTITAKGFTEDSLFGPELKVLIENDSERDLTVQTRNSSVNGYMVDTSISADVKAGKKANDSITFYSSDLEACGIETIADMEFSFHIFFSDDWETYLDSEQIQLTTSAAAGYVYSYDDSGELLYDGNGIRILSKGMGEEDPIFGPELLLYIENNGEQAVTIQDRDVSVNGFMVSTSLSEDVLPGKRSIAGLTFMNSSLEENGIETLEEVELSLHIFDPENWKTIADTETITLMLQ